MTLQKTSKISIDFVVVFIIHLHENKMSNINSQK